MGDDIFTCHVFAKANLSSNEQQRKHVYIDWVIRSESRNGGPFEYLSALLSGTHSEC